MNKNYKLAIGMVLTLAIICVVSAFRDTETSKPKDSHHEVSTGLFAKPLVTPRELPVRNYGKVSDALGGQGHVSNILVGFTPVEHAK